MEKRKQNQLSWQIEEFMICCKSKDLRRKTMKSYEQTLRLFERWCRETLDISYVDEVSENVIRRYINELQERGKYSYCANDKSKTYNAPERTLPTAELRILSFCYHVNQFLKASHLLFLSLSEYRYMLFLWRTQTNTDFCTQNDSSGTEFEG